MVLCKRLEPLNKHSYVTSATFLLILFDFDIPITITVLLLNHTRPTGQQANSSLNSSSDRRQTVNVKLKLSTLTQDHKTRADSADTPTVEAEYILNS